MSWEDPVYFGQCQPPRDDPCLPKKASLSIAQSEPANSFRHCKIKYTFSSHELLFIIRFITATESKLGHTLTSSLIHSFKGYVNTVEQPFPQTNFRAFFIPKSLATISDLSPPSPSFFFLFTLTPGNHLPTLSTSFTIINNIFFILHLHPLTSSPCVSKPLSTHSSGNRLSAPSSKISTSGFHRNLSAPR